MSTVTLCPLDQITDARLVELLAPSTPWNRSLWSLNTVLTHPVGRSSSFFPVEPWSPPFPSNGKVLNDLGLLRELLG
jgi:hypothetical protein